MAKKPLRGVEQNQEVDPQHLYRDTRSGVSKAIDSLKRPQTMLLTLVAIFGGAVWFHPIADFAIPVGVPMVAWALTRPEEGPVKLPIQCGLPDPKQPHPANDKPTSAKGIFYLGNEMKTGKEIWLTNDDCRQHFLVLGTTGAGKAQPLDAKVHTPDGWRRMGDIRVGDEVTTPDGGRASVDGVYPQGAIPVYRVTFKDGRSTEACGEHLWEVHHKHWRGKYRPGQSRAGCAEPRILKTSEVAERLETNKGTFSVRLPQPVEKPEAELPIDPYVLGVLLGDGGFSGNRLVLSTADMEVAESVAARLPAGVELYPYDSSKPYDFDIRVTGGARNWIGGRCPDGSYRSNPLRQALRDLGMAGCGSHEKRVPEMYMKGSVAQRLDVLRGLLDSDGSVEKNGVVSFSSSSRELAECLCELVWSLGGVTNLRERTASYTSGGVRREGRVSYRVTIRHPNPERLFMLTRKLDKLPRKYQYADSLKLAIDSVEYVGEKECQCIHIDDSKHLYITDDYIVTHNTETLLGFAANSLSWGSGFLFTDGKGDVALFAKIYALARRFSREDDLLVLNFMTGNQDLGLMGGKLMSNTLNPFSSGSSDNLTQMVVGLMDEAGGDSAMWKGRATAMFTGVMKALTWLRDSGQVDLNVGEIRDFLNLRRIIDLASPEVYPDMPQHIRKAVKSYLTSLPGYQPEKGYKQSQTTLDQHGYLEMQFTKILGSLADVYGHIFHTPSGEVDMHDVVLNRRILVVMLPALEKSGDEIANIGKIVVATLKGMMGSALGSQIEGSWEKIVEQRQTSSPSPFMTILDEVGYYTVEGMALMAAQARSLGFSMCYASQDIPAMLRLNDKEANSIIANTNTKIFMRTEEPDKTGKLASDLGDEAQTVRASSYQGESGNVGLGYKDTQQAGVTNAKRVSLLDLKSQKEGEMHVMYKDYVIRARGFYANPEGSVKQSALRLRANHFVKIAKPSRDELQAQANVPHIKENLLDPAHRKSVQHAARKATEDLRQRVKAKDEIAATTYIMERAARRRSFVDAACAAVANIARDCKASVNALEKEIAERSSTGAKKRSTSREDKGGTQNQAAAAGASDQQELDDTELEHLQGMSESASDALADSAPLGESEEGSSRSDEMAVFERIRSRVDSDVPHAVGVDDDESVDMVEKAASSGTMGEAFARLEFDDEEGDGEGDSGGDPFGDAFAVGPAESGGGGKKADRSGVVDAAETAEKAGGEDSESEGQSASDGSEALDDIISDLLGDD